MTERMTERDIELPGGRFDDSHSRTNSKKPQESSSDAPAKIKAKRSSQNQQSSSPAGIKGKKLKKKVRSKSKSQEHAKNPKQSTKEQRPSSRSRLNAGTKVKLEGESYGNKDGERDEGSDDQQEERMQGEDDGGGDSDDDDEYEVAISDTTTGRPTTRGSSAAAGKPASSDKSPKKSRKSTGKGEEITIPTVDDSDQNLARIMKLPSKAKKSQMAQIFKPVFSEFVCEYVCCKL